MSIEKELQTVRACSRDHRAELSTIEQRYRKLEEALGVTEKALREIAAPVLGGRHYHQHLQGIARSTLQALDEASTNP